jgi:serine/threonine protein kinase
MTSASDHPQRVGPYRVLQTIGEGGMGIVYEADQTDPIQRRVALKVVKLGMDTREVVARFESERQALAMMDHPGIARVLDAGATESGRPFFVMELVRGISLTDYCDTHKLSVRARLELIVSVCQAVQHAHQKGVIHRDLKPSNILVAEQDGTASWASTTRSRSRPGTIWHSPSTCSGATPRRIPFTPKRCEACVRCSAKATRSRCIPRSEQQ